MLNYCLGVVTNKYSHNYKKFWHFFVNKIDIQKNFREGGYNILNSLTDAYFRKILIMQHLCIIYTVLVNSEIYHKRDLGISTNRPRNVKVYEKQ